MSPEPARVAVYALTEVGLAAAGRLAAGLVDVELAGRPVEAVLFAPNRLIDRAPDGVEVVGFDKLAPAVADNWAAFDGHAFFCAAGIVIRSIAPLVVSKTADPAVICLDQRGAEAISLLSGHLGGANDLARSAAEIMDGRAVITTATDTEGLPSLEVEAQRLGYRVDNLAALSRVSLALIEGREVRVCDPEARLSPVLAWEWPDLFPVVQDPAELDPGEPGVVVSWRAGQFDPAWLLIRPNCLSVGVGCNRGTSAREIIDFIDNVFSSRDLAVSAIDRLVSVDAKSDEPGLLEAARRLGVTTEFFDRAELADIETPNPSAMVEKHLGVKSVCEAAALLAAKTGRLMVDKQKKGNVTLAVAGANCM